MSDKSIKHSASPTASTPNLQVTIRGKTVNSGQGGNVDIVFVFDTTGSMNDKIVALLNTCEQFVSDLDNHQLRYKVGFVAFGDLTVPTDTIQRTKMTDQLNVFKQMINNLPRNDGGANDGESSLEALHAGLPMFHPLNEAEAIRVFILITDEPALNATDGRVKQVLATLQKQEIITFCVTPSLNYFKTIATKTGGCWLEIGPDTSLTVIKQTLLDLVKRLTKVVTEVNNPQLGGGSVKAYLALTQDGSSKST